VTAPVTRRGLLAGALGVPLLLGAGTRPAFAEEETDASILESALGLEQVSVFAYRAAERSGLLDSAGERMARRFARQEQEHVEALSTGLEALGATSPPPPRTLAEVDRVLPGLGDARSKIDVLTFAVELETAAVAAYLDAVPKLRDPKLLQTAASIMANEGQHLVVLRLALRQEPVPRAFDTGDAR
jgi:ferritin-like protein